MTNSIQGWILVGLLPGACEGQQLLLTRVPSWLILALLTFLKAYERTGLWFETQTLLKKVCVLCDSARSGARSEISLGREKHYWVPEEVSERVTPSRHCWFNVNSCDLKSAP